LIGISGPGVSASFIYDALGRRVSKTINGVRTDYQYDGNDIIAEIGGGAVATTYLRSLNIDEPFMRQSGSGNEYYHADALGSVMALTDQTGVVQTTYRYEPFGKTTIIGASTNPFQYTGRENDGTGLYYYRARYYNSSLQRFISEDPIEFLAGSVNLYSYVSNNPPNLIDPLGLEHEGFIKQLSEMADKSLRRTIKSLEKNLEQAIKDVADPNLAREINHNLHKVRLFREQASLALKEAGRRGLKIGILGILLDELLFPDEANAEEMELLREVCPERIRDPEPGPLPNPNPNPDPSTLPCSGRKC
jgi:RHS repeat-associated protein